MVERSEFELSVAQDSHGRPEVLCENCCKFSDLMIGETVAR
jgi:hypothetical protein